jgi:pimeloyl-ACP methyl ester carboxylesterase/DNA-binding winged helix-turn-helix (wHTH) protein
VDPSSTLLFGEFRLDPVRGQLFRGRDVVPLPPKAFTLLQYMTANPGRLIPKRELLASVWPGVYVSDDVLKTTVRDLRKALNDDSHSPRFIETAHRRGYRFIGVLDASSAPAFAPAGASAGSSASARQADPGEQPRDLTVTALGAQGGPSASPIRYAHSGDVNIAYQVVGSGERDIVFVMGWVSHLEYFWNEPSFSRFLLRLAANARLILFDKRGTGRSDPVPVSAMPTLEQRLDDVRAVMEAAGSERAVLMGVSEGGPLCSLFAATYPSRTEALIMIGSYARRLRDTDYPWGPTVEERDRFCQTILEQWGGPVGLEERAPSRANDPAFRQWWASYLRMGASPGAAVALTKMNSAIDIRGVLPSIKVPTLVIHRTGDQLLRIEEGRYLASRVPGAEFVELPGADHLPFVGDQDAIVETVEKFLSHRRHRIHDDQLLASVLTIEADGPVPDACETEVRRLRGHLVVREGKSLVATFDGPGRAVGCASVLITLMAEFGVRARAGVHVGECNPAMAQGPVFEASRELAETAVPGAVHASRTVVDLVPGSGLLFEPVTTDDSVVWRVVR